MTYAEALKTLNDAADYARNQRALCAQLSELKEAKQYARISKPCSEGFRDAG